MTESRDVRSIVKGHIVQELLQGDDSAVNSDGQHLLTSGLLDSIAILRLMMFLEETFSIEIASHEAGVEHFDTVDGVVSLVESKLRS